MPVFVRVADWSIVLSRTNAATWEFLMELLGLFWIFGRIQLKWESGVWFWVSRIDGLFSVSVNLIAIYGNSTRSIQCLEIGVCYLQIFVVDSEAMLETPAFADWYSVQGLGQKDWCACWYSREKGMRNAGCVFLREARLWGASQKEMKPIDGNR